MKINTTLFYNNSAFIEGGAVYVQNIIFEDSLSNYTLNRAGSKGGGAWLFCDELVFSEFFGWCSSDFFQNSFESNSANEGGALSYNSIEPTQIFSNSFRNNTAKYGQNYAAFPF